MQMDAGKPGSGCCCAVGFALVVLLVRGNDANDTNTYWISQYVFELIILSDRKSPQDAGCFEG